jgi:CheY-like chemotaxis protein
MAALLNLCGHESVAAYGGTEGVKVATDFKPDVVMIDLMMPGMDGFQVVKELRRSLYCRDAVLVAFTALSDNHSRELTAEAGFDFHLSKPAPMDKILKVLAEATVPDYLAAAKRGSNLSEIEIPLPLPDATPSTSGAKV